MRIIETQPNTQDAIDLMDGLSKNLELITGDSGKTLLILMMFVFHVLYL